MKNISLLLFALILASQAISQTYMTQNGTITFFSEAPLENIEAVNNQVSSVIDLSTGQMEAQLLIKAFSFEKALMQHHFNERYLESHTYPKAKFEGQILNIDDVNISTEPTEVEVKGSLTLHGETNDVNTKATLKKYDDGKIHGESVFYIKLDDYKIEVPSGVRNKIAEEIEVTIDFDYESM